MYHVGWKKSAGDELAAIWVDGDSTLREAITKAAAQIDILLKNSPGDVGESREPNRRIAFVPPIGFIFAVDQAKHRANVLHVWLY
jgi:hypothetical protein